MNDVELHRPVFDASKQARALIGSLLGKAAREEHRNGKKEAIIRENRELQVPWKLLMNFIVCINANTEN